MASVELQTEAFRRSLPLQVCLQEIARAMGSPDGLTCLEIGSQNGVASLQFRKLGGTWHTVVANEELAESIRAIVPDQVHVAENGKLPYNKKLFDVVIVVGYLERFADDIAFIEQCHKILKPDGRLVVHVNRLGPWLLIRGLRRLLGLKHERIGFARPGYTESHLFAVLKSGFDVHHVRAYSRFFVELTDAIVERLTLRHQAEDPRTRRLLSVAGVFYRIAFQLDLVLLLSRGYRLIAVAKRRGWRPRNAPILVDGRSISEAVLSKAWQ